MFKNIVGKIKTLATVITWVGIIFSVSAGIFMMAIVEDYIFPGILVAGIGSLGAWVGSFILYGFGELIEKVTEIAQNTSNGNTASPSNEQEATSFTHSTVSAPESVPQPSDRNKWNGKCQMCDEENVMVSAAVIIDDMGTRHRNVCDDCFEKYNCIPEK